VQDGNKRIISIFISRFNLTVVKIKFLVLFFLLAFSLTIHAQQTGLVAFDVLATKLERTHHVKLYYKSRLV